MDSISTARDFFINQQGLSPDQADMIVSKGMEAYNQQSQPQNMMQMASGGRIGYAFGKSVSATFTAQPGGSVGEARGIGGLLAKAINNNPQMFRPAQELPSRATLYQTRATDFIDENQNGIDDRQEAAYGGRIGYQMGGVSTMPMDTGQSLQIPQQMPTNFSSAQSITMNPLLNYGQPELGQAGGTPLSMNRGGIARLGYQMGGEAMMQPQGMQQEQGMGQLGEGDNALLTIIQLLIEQGIDPQTAEKLARQILQIFAQGGEPALDQFINQLEQQEQTEAMAAGGIAGYGYRQGYGLGSIVKSIGKGISGAVKGVAKAVKSVAKSPIGRIALTIGATMLMGPAGLNLGAGVFGASNAFLAGAINAGAANLLVQGITTGKFNPKEALMAGAIGGLTSGLTQPGTVDTSSALNNTSNITTDLANKGIGPLPSAGDAIYTDYPSSITSNVAANAPTYTGLESDISSMTGTGYAAPKPNLPFQLQGAGDGSVIDANAITSDYSYPGTIDKLRTSASNYGTDLMNKAQTGIQSLYKDPIGTVSDLASSAYKTVKDNAIPLVTGAVAGKYLFGSPQQPDESDEDFDQRRKAETNEYVTLYGGNLNIKDADFYAREKARNPFAPTMAANGGIMGYRKGGSMVPPARQIEGGIIELDARKSGGYIPYGKKERVDDVPAMLAKDEFVFTSRAVKAAGGGSAKRGAEKMYALMKQLESKGARA
jgi:hypothetical protein